MLISTRTGRWAPGEPVAVACGPSRNGEGPLEVGLLLVAPRIKADRITLVPAGDPAGARTTVIWPAAYRNLPEPKRFTNVTLEVAP